MKRILIIISLLVLVLNSYSQSETEKDIIKAKEELYIEDVNFTDWLEDSTASANARNAGNGLRLVGNDIDQGGDLDSSMVLNGNGWNYELGTTSSNIANFKLYTSGLATISTGTGIAFGANGIPWIFDGTYWYSIAGDTLTNFDDVRALIEASENTLPYNWDYTFSSVITDSRPGVGLFRLNNATLANVTEIYIDYYDADNVAQNDFLAMADTGSSLAIITDANNYALYKATGGYVDNSNYYTYNVTYQSHNGVISGLSTIDLDISNSTGSGGGVADSSWYQTETVVAKIDTVEYASGQRMTNIPQNNIFLWDSTNSNYKPYSNFQANSFYYSSTNPTGTTRLNWDGYIYATQVRGNSSTLQGVRGTSDSNSGVYGVSNSGSAGSFEQFGTSATSQPVLLLNRNKGGTLNVTGNIISIVDNPTTTGTVSGAVLSATIDGTEKVSLNPRAGVADTAYTIDTDDLLTTGVLLSVENQNNQVFEVNPTGVSINGSEVITGSNTSKYVMQNTNTDKIQTDTLISETDSVTIFDIERAVRKILYPNDYASYLPNDSLYTTPSITLNTPTKVLIPTAIKYARNWALFDKGGSDFALRYEASDSSRFHITMTTSMRTSASNVIFEVFMYKNGVIEPGVAVERKIGTGADVGAISVTGAFDVDTNDYIEIFVLVDVTTTITFSKTSIIIKEDGLISNP
jgi:hypothetical protein